MKDKSACPVCQSPSVELFLSRREIPIHQNLLMEDETSAVQTPRGDLELAVCHSCGFIFNQAFDLSRLQYGASYENKQECSPYFNQYLERLANRLTSEKQVTGARVVEIGCGQGYFLRKLVAAGNTGYGFDPSYSGPASDLDGKISFEKRYYDEDCANVIADVVVCRHVIEHVPRPLTLLRSVRRALINSPRARVFFETPCVEWILRNGIVWDLFYEHCSYFSAASLTTAFESSGFRVESVRHVFEDQYLWLEAVVSDSPTSPSLNPGPIPQLASEFAAAESRLSDLAVQLKELSAKGGVALWGAGAKGVTLANLLDKERSLLSCVVDLNSKKQGRYIPGTGHPIVHYRDLPSFGVKTAVLMNPNYREENLNLLREANIEIDLIELELDPYETHH